MQKGKFLPMDPAQDQVLTLGCPGHAFAMALDRVGESFQAIGVEVPQNQGEVNQEGILLSLGNDVPRLPVGKSWRR
jgi:hypothetical protein